MNAANLSNSATAWVAGLLEGEGCFMLTPKQGGAYYSAKVSCNMTDRDVLEKLQAITQIGRLNGPYNDNPSKHKDHWRWNVCKRSDAESLLRAIYPLMGMRRRVSISRILTYYEEHPKRSWRHGTMAGYERHQCRCTSCRSANAAKGRKYRAGCGAECDEAES